MKTNYQLNELEIKKNQYLKVIHNSSIHASVAGFFDFLRVFEEERERKEDKEKYNEDNKLTYVIYALIQGIDFETWVWKFVVHEYHLEGSFNDAVNDYLIKYYGSNNEERWVLIWDYNDGVDPDKWYDEHLREKFGDGTVYNVNDKDDDDDELVVITLRGVEGGGYETVDTVDI